MLADIFTRVVVWFTGSMTFADPCAYCGMAADPNRMCDDCWDEMVARDSRATNLAVREA